MKLIGMLDSPYVRRVAISFQLLGLRFEHQSLSVFRNFDEFSAINPVVKAPSLICDDGQVLMDSTLILQYAQAMAPQRSLLPTGITALQRELQLIGLALAATEKSVQVVYERGLRPPEKLHEPWMNRVTGQLLAAYRLLEAEWVHVPNTPTRDTLSQAGITLAVAWHFTQQTSPELVPEAGFPRLAAYSKVAERLAEFQAAPHGDGTVRVP